MRGGPAILDAADGAASLAIPRIAPTRIDVPVTAVGLPGAYAVVGAPMPGASTAPGSRTLFITAQATAAFIDAGRRKGGQWG